MKIPLGTLIRCADITAERLEFYQRIGLSVLQLAGVGEEYLMGDEKSRAKSEALLALCEKYSLRVPCMFLSYPGQDWSHPSETVGLTPEAYRAERMILSCRQIRWAEQYGMKYVSCHVGFFPEKGTESYARLVREMRQLVMFAEACGLQFLLETGMETANDLQTFFKDLAPACAGINFDPANLLIYDRDDPETFLDLLQERVRIVHCKDAVRPQTGSACGKETVLGAGQTKIIDLLNRLRNENFDGYWIIERELPPGEEQERDIAQAVELIKSIEYGECK